MNQAAFTVDVEDWFHGLQPDPSRWGPYERRCHKGMAKLLELLDRHETKATFFVLGDVARHQADIVREIDRRGHEIGSHGMFHQRVGGMTPDQFRTDLRQSAALLADITGKRVAAYRAPFFSLGPGMQWAFDILAETGIEHDSSLCPARTPHYGSPGAARAPHLLRPGLVEWPVSVVSVGGYALPFAGGAYFRLYPRWLFALLLARHGASGLPLIFYVHPWELDAEQPRSNGLALETRFRHYAHLSRTEARLDWLLGQRRFGPLSSLTLGGERPEGYGMARIDAVPAE